MPPERGWRERNVPSKGKQSVQNDSCATWTLCLNTGIYSSTWLKSPGGFSFCETGSEKCFGAFQAPQSCWKIPTNSSDNGCQSPHLRAPCGYFLLFSAQSGCEWVNLVHTCQLFLLKRKGSLWGVMMMCVCARARERVCVCVWLCVSWWNEILVNFSDFFHLHPNDPALPHTVILRMETCCLFKYDALLWLLFLRFSLTYWSTCCIWIAFPRDSSPWLWRTRASESYTEELPFWACLLPVIQWHVLSTYYVPAVQVLLPVLCCDLGNSWHRRECHPRSKMGPRVVRKRKLRWRVAREGGLRTLYRKDGPHHSLFVQHVHGKDMLYK